jgi:hypothetical protein
LQVFVTVCVHPVAGAQLSAVQAIVSSQLSVPFPGWQDPALHASPSVQALESLHCVPFGALGLEHTPVVVLHVPATWHWSDAVHTTGLPPAQAPAWHVSVWVQALASLQVVPLGALGFEHWPVAVLHVPAT